MEQTSGYWIPSSSIFFASKQKPFWIQLTRCLITPLTHQDSGLGSPVDENPPMQRYHEATTNRASWAGSYSTCWSDFRIAFESWTFKNQSWKQQLNESRCPFKWLNKSNQCWIIPVLIWTCDDLNLGSWNINFPLARWRRWWLLLKRL